MATAYANVLQEISTKDGIRIPNNTGIAYNVQASDFQRLRRFLTIGTDGGTYYASERDITKANTDHLIKCLNEYGTEVVDLIVEVSVNGAPKQQPQLFALAIAAAHADTAVRKAALSSLRSVCRTASTLFQFLEYVTPLRGWGRTLKTAVREWYESYYDTANLAYQMVKYRNRNGWTHKKALLYSHTLGKTPDRVELYNWAYGDGFTEETSFESLLFVYAFEALKEAESTEEVVEILNGAGSLPFEAIPNEFLKYPEIWATLIRNGSLPYTAMMRNLGRMTALGVFDDTTVRNIVGSRLSDPEYVQASRVHPMNVLNASMTYERGQSEQLSWTPNRYIADELSIAFYASFKNIEPTGKRILLAIDTSSSMVKQMTSGFKNISCAQAATAMAMATLASEPRVDVVLFDTTVREEFLPTHKPIGLVMRDMLFHGGGTGCNLPFMWAYSNEREYDAIVMYTDDEHNYDGRRYGTNSPNAVYDALDAYRARFSMNCKLINVAMVANELSFARKTDRNTLDIAGFSSDAPQVISQFIMGNL